MVARALDVPAPDSVDGRSLYSFLRGGEPAAWRESLHIEHAPNHQCLTDGREKYIWWPSDGREHLFDLASDPRELEDLARTPVHRERVAAWRTRLIAALAGRPEGFVHDGRLIHGRPYASVIPGTNNAQ